MKKINYKNGEECLHLKYKDMKNMTIEDAIFILSEPVEKYHLAKDDKHRVNLPRPRLIRAYELLIEYIQKNINTKEKINEYINELDIEYDRCIQQAENFLSQLDEKDKFSTNLEYEKIVERAKVLNEVKNDLESRLNEK